MERLDVAELLIDQSEIAVSVPVRTRGSGDHSAPVVLLSGLDSFPRAKGNSSKDGLVDTNGDGVVDSVVLSHQYEATAKIETRAKDEVQSFQMAKAIRDQLAQFEEFPSSFHDELNSLMLGEVKQGGFQAPTPEPVYKHVLEISLDFGDEVIINSPDTISSFDNSISNS